MFLFAVEMIDGYSRFHPRLHVWRTLHSISFHEEILFGSFEVSGQTSTFTTYSNYVTIVLLLTQLLLFFSCSIRGFPNLL